MTSEDIFWLAINLYHEARGEPLDGQKAVCHVVLNRAKQKGQTIKQIVLAPFQFSWANKGARPPIREYEALQHCFEAANAAIAEQSAFITLEGANHYFSDSITAPAWMKNMTFICKCGHHLFYRS